MKNFKHFVFAMQGAFIMPERRYRRDTVDSQKAVVMEKPQLEKHTAEA